MRLRLSDAIIADIYAYGDDRPYAGPTWPLECGAAIILCPDCGELDDADGTVHSNDQCRGCKDQGFVIIGM